MSDLPIIAIVGRPNVGKSSLLNCIARRRIGIVDPTAGVTRDRISTVCRAGDSYFELVDTGGFGIEDHDNLTEHVEEQIRYAIHQAAIVLFIVDAREGVVALDQDVARMLRGYDRRVLLVANKVDTTDLKPLIGEFCRLGFGEPVAVSAQQGTGRDRLLAELGRQIGESGPPPPDPTMQIAVVGKRNSGKSTFINTLAGEPRVIVSEVPGTTRDAVDVRFEKDGHSFMVIDTAGVRKKNKMSSDIEYYSFVRAQKAIVRADVVLLFIDATIDVGQVDKKLGRFVSDNDKPCILVVNKWDLVKGQVETSAYEEYFTKVLPELDYAPISVITAENGKGVHATVDLAQNLFKQALKRVTTGQLNKAIEAIQQLRGPTSLRGPQAVKIYYGTQVSVCPPTIILFVNNPALIREEYRRFVLNRLREALPFEEIPIRLIFRSHRQGADNGGDGRRQTSRS